jgi:hypothetical protein
MLATLRRLLGAPIRVIPAADQREYHIGSTEADRYRFEAVVVRPMHQGVTDHLNVLTENFGIDFYDMVSVEGGAMRIAKYGVGEETVAAIEVSYRLHQVKRAILIGLNCSKKHGITNSYCWAFRDEASVARQLAASHNLLAAHLVEKGMRMEIHTFMLSLSPDGQKIYFYQIDPASEGEKRSLIYTLPWRGRKESDSVVVWCMDARFRQATNTYLRAVLGLDHYGLVSIPGGAKGILTHGDKSTAMDCIDSCVIYHGARNVHLINHMDCGAYGGTKAFCCHEEEYERMTSDLDAAARVIVARYPHLKVHTHLQRAEGEKVYFRLLKTFAV